MLMDAFGYKKMRRLLPLLVLFCLLSAHALSADVFPTDAHATGAKERILDLRTGESITPEALLAQIRQQDVVLLGEVHDNPRHHELRGQLLRALAPQQPYVVAEQLEYGKRYQPQGALLDDLTRAGFSAKSWDWPLHEPLFRSIAEAGITLVGGNLALESARKVVREGEAALPPAFAASIKDAPLAAEASQTLDQDLLDGHCGHLKASMLPGMRLSQRARDAAMFSALQEGPADRLKVLLAGNGHLRSDYGVPVMLQQLSPQQKWLSIAFIEQDAAEDPKPELQQRHTHAWITPAHARPDPCADFGKR